jgi:hypothetical protein
MEGIRRDRPDDSIPQPGEYGKHSNGSWFACPPGQFPDEYGFYLDADLSHHGVTEHEDGTITVTPSILIRDHRGREWHGFLERGQWRQV